MQMQKYYINLDERTDRRTAFEEEMARVNWSVTRVPAIKKQRGAWGCALSHINVLDRHLSNYPNDICIIMEDDFAWKSEPDLTFLDTLENWDVVILAAGLHDLKYDCETNLPVRRLYCCQTTTAYTVHPRYLETLKKNFEDSASKLAVKRRGNEIDVGWKSLQAQDRWFIMIPGWGYQRPSYSDIERKQVDYPFI